MVQHPRKDPLEADAPSSQKVLREFVHAASHDLQEPIRVVSTYLTLLESKVASKLDASEMLFLKRAKTSAERMKAMIDGLLDYSRVETDLADVCKTSLHECLNAALGNLQLMIESSGAVVECALPLPEVCVLESQMVCVFQNLISNAIRFRGETPPHIRITCSPSESEILLSVADNGIGIPEAFRESIFNVFFRVNPTSGVTGSGMGLAIVRRIVERHGGRIWCLPNDPRGSIFRVLLSVPENCRSCDDCHPLKPHTP